VTEVPVTELGAQVRRRAVPHRPDDLSGAGRCFRQPVEVTFKIFPGEVFTGRAKALLQAIASGQTQTGGTAVAPAGIASAPLIMSFKSGQSVP